MMKFNFRKKQANKSQIYLHVGTNKTGTSSLQKFLSQDENQKIYNYYYPKNYLDEEYQTAHHPLSKLLKVKEGRSLKLNKGFVEEIKSNEKIIISSENLFRSSLHALREFQKIFSDCEIVPIIYLRQPVKYKVSWYQQSVHGNGNICDVVTFSRANRISYSDIIKKFDAVFGEKTIVRCYDKTSLRNSDVISDFLFVTALDKNYKNVNRLNENLSINGFSFDLILLVNCLCHIKGIDIRGNSLHDEFLDLGKELNDIGGIKVSQWELGELNLIERPNIEFFKNRFPSAILSNPSITARDEKNNDIFEFIKENDFKSYPNTKKMLKILGLNY